MSEALLASARGARSDRSGVHLRKKRGSRGRRLAVSTLSVLMVAATAATCTKPAPPGPPGVTITAASATIDYGDAIPATTASYAGLPTGQTETTTPPTCATTATSTSPPGTYDTYCADAVQSGLPITYVNGTITITAAPVTVTASSASMAYGGSVPAISATYDGLKNGETAPAVLPTCGTTATSTSPVGSYPSTCAGASDANYAFSYTDGSVVIGKVGVTVTASSGTSAYGATPPVISAAYDGFVNGDTEPSTLPTCSTSATSTSPAGSYTSTCTGAADPNYTFTYTDGTVTVSPAAAVVTASSAAVTFNEAIPAITPSYSGLVNGDVAPAIAPTCTTTATAGSPTGAYPSTCSGAADPNYSFTYVGGTVSITTSSTAVVVVASSSTINYGDPVPAVTASYAGFSGGQTTPATAATCTTTATATSPAGTYPTTCSGAADPNYTFSYVDGTVTVLARPATIAASSAAMTYGGTVPTVTAAYSGLVNGDTAAATPPTCSTTATSTSPAGTFPSTCSGAADANYSFTYVPGTITVNKAPATVTASSASMTEGAAVPAITPTYGGLVLGQSVPATPATSATTATSTSPAGTYPSSCSGAADPNHTFSYTGGTVTVNPVPPAGFAEYTPSDVHTTTVTAAGTLPAATISVAGTTGFKPYTNLTVQSANGPQGVFCKGVTATSFTTCQLGSGAIAADNFVSDAAPLQFDVYTIIPGGAAAVQPSSLTIVNDVPAADRGMPSGVTATTANGLITYVQSAAPTGTFDLTFGWCATGTVTYSAADPNCHTGTITYGPGVVSNMGARVSVSITTNNVYQKVRTAVIGPTSVPNGTTFTAYSAAGAAAIPRLQSSVIGDVTVNTASKFVAISPIPPGMTYVSSKLIGGDAKTAGKATVTFCPTLTTPGCMASTGTNFSATTVPFLQVGLPASILVNGGTSVTMPTIALTLRATGASGSTSNFSLTEFQTSLAVTAPIVGNQTANFFGYPTTGEDTGITPPKAPPSILGSIAIT